MNKNHNYNPDAIPVPEQGTASYKGIHQLYRNIPNVSNHEHIFPVTYTQSVYDGKTGASLEHILHQFNHIFLQFQGTAQATRNLLPKDMRRKGIMISYRDMDDNMITERNIDETESNTDNWGLDKYWEKFEGYSINMDDIQDQIDKILEQLKDLIESGSDELITNLFNQYIEGDEFKSKVQSIVEDVVNNYLEENLEPIVGEYFTAIVDYIKQNERVMANALARHEQAITDLQAN